MDEVQYYALLKHGGLNLSCIKCRAVALIPAGKFEVKKMLNVEREHMKNTNHPLSALVPRRDDFMAKIPDSYSDLGDILKSYDLVSEAEFRKGPSRK